MLLYIVRHGDPNYNPDSLTPKGHLQAQALAKRFAVHGLDKIFASPLNRAQQTAAPTAEMLGLPVEIEEWTSENLAYAQLSALLEPGRRSWIFHQQLTNVKNNETVHLSENWYDAPCFADHKESVIAGYNRIADASDAFLKRLGYERDGAIYKVVSPNEQRIAVFCHQGFGVTWLAHLLQIPPHIFWSSFDLSHSSVTLLEFTNYENGITAPQCLFLSDLSHILREGLPLQYNNRLDI